MLQTSSQTQIIIMFIRRLIRGRYSMVRIVRNTIPLIIFLGSLMQHRMYNLLLFIKAPQ